MSHQDLTLLQKRKRWAWAPSPAFFFLPKGHRMQAPASVFHLLPPAAAACGPIKAASLRKAPGMGEKMFSEHSCVRLGALKAQLLRVTWCHHLHWEGWQPPTCPLGRKPRHPQVPCQAGQQKGKAQALKSPEPRGGVPGATGQD